MSDNWLRLLPTDPAFEPDPLQRGRALNAFRRLVPNASEVVEELEEQVVFLDAGSNFESIHCPACAAEITVEWWRERMDSVWHTRFDDLAIITPCCSTGVSLNDLTYVWPQGFARWYLSAMNPGRGLLSQDEISSVEAVLGVRLREVWTHL